MFLTPAGRTLFVIAVLLLGTPGTSIFADGKGPRQRNSYLPADDVALGAEAAAEIRANVPLVKEARSSRSSSAQGTRLTATCST